MSQSSDNKKRPRREQLQQSHGILRVGTAGWTKAANWRGPFYPPGTKSTGEAMLDAYQQHLRTVENNGTCHSMPSKETVTKWKAKCGKSFLMSPKVVKDVTHSGPKKKDTTTSSDNETTTTTNSSMSDDSLEALRTFADRVALLGENLGPMLLQFPRTRRVRVEDVCAMARILGESDLPRNAKIAFEVRNQESMADQELIQELTNLKWALVVHPNSIGRGTVLCEQREGAASLASSGKEYELERIVPNDWPATAGDWVYIRLHGSNDEHTGRYSDEGLRKQAIPAMVEWLQEGKDVYAYILNDDDKAGMPLAAKALEKLCYKELGSAVPRAPKQVKSIASFFTTKSKP